ncbi:flagellar filament capping protein FliD [bacterium]|nr:flagellar filament capping protein FliD [bacterium]
MSSVGLATGLDTDTLIAQLMSIERRPVLRLENKIKSRNTQLAVYTDLRSRLDSLRSAVSGIKTAAAFSKFTATSSNEEVATVSASGEAQAGTHTMKVTQLATNAISVSQSFASNSASIGTGTFRLSIGGEDHDIEITSSNNTIKGLRDAINAADTGVTASIVQDDASGNSFRLVLSSDETGTENAHTVSLQGWSGTAPAFTDGSGETAGQQAQDAQFTFDGISVTKSANEVDDLIDGVTLFLRDDSSPTTPVTIKIESNAAEVKNSIQGFVDAYNDAVTYLRDKGRTADMRGDVTFSQLLSSLQNLVAEGNPDATGAYTRMSQVGITSQSGKLTINADTLTSALEDHFDDVVSLFTTRGTTSDPNVIFLNNTTATQGGSYAVEITGVGSQVTGTIGGYAANSYSGNFLIGAEGTPVEGMMIQFTGGSTGSYGNINFAVGLMESFERSLNDILKSNTGTIATREQRIEDGIEGLQEQIETKERSLTRTEQALRTKFTHLEQLVSQLQSSQNALLALQTRSFGR